MARKERNVGKPSLDNTIGTGSSEVIKMPCVGKVYEVGMMDGSTISRDPGQDKPHMKVERDSQGGKFRRWRT